MLTQMRTFTRGWIAYLLLFILVIAFAIWGVNDVFSGIGQQSVARVDGRNITPQELNRELELTLRSQRAQGQNPTQQEAIDSGLHLQLLDSMIARVAMDRYADRVGIGASDVQVAARIRDIPAVLNPVTGAFDETSYDRFLQQLGYSRPEFEQDVRGQITTQMLMQAMVSGVRAPSSYGALLYAFQSEERTVTIAEAPVSVVGQIPAPTEAQIQAYYEDNAQRLTLPEFRVLTFVYARPSDFVSRVNVPEARIREEFEARAAMLAQPERRSYVRIAAQTQAQAQEAAQRLQRGESPDAIAAAMRLQASRGENQSRTEVPDAAVAEAVFAAAPRSAPRVVQGRLSDWVVVRVDAVTPAVTANYAEHREEIRNAIAQDEAAELLTEAVRVFEEARAAGVSVADAARRAGLPTMTTVPVANMGRDQRGQPVAALAGHDEALAIGFETSEGEASDFIPTEDADVIVSVDRVIPAAVQPLDEVRQGLVAEWRLREQLRRLRELGEKIVADVRGGQSFAAAAQANGLRITQRARTYSREAAGEQFSEALAGQIFGAAENQVITGVRNDGGGIQAAIVERIQRRDPAADPQGAENAREQMEQSLVSSFGRSVQDDIVARARPRRNQEVIDRTFRRSADAEGEQGQ